MPEDSSKTSAYKSAAVTPSLSSISSSASLILSIDKSLSAKFSTASSKILTSKALST